MKVIFKMQWFHFENISPYQFFYTTTFIEAMKFNFANTSKPGYTSRTSLQVHHSYLYGERPKIILPQYKNLLKLLQIIPPIHHELNRSFRHEEGRKRRMAWQKIIIGEDENAEDIGAAVLETYSE
jgi:hypothetical protein